MCVCNVYPPPFFIEPFWKEILHMPMMWNIIITQYTVYTATMITVFRVMCSSILGKTYSLVMEHISHSSQESIASAVKIFCQTLPGMYCNDTKTIIVNLQTFTLIHCYKMFIRHTLQYALVWGVIKNNENFAYCRLCFQFTFFSHFGTTLYDVHVNFGEY